MCACMYEYIHMQSFDLHHIYTIFIIIYIYISLNFLLLFYLNIYIFFTSMLSFKKQVKGTFWILSSVFFDLIQTCIKTSTAV